MSSRNRILGKLRAAQPPFTEIPPVDDRRHMVPLEDQSLESLQARFITEAEKVECNVHIVSDDEAAIEQILEIVSDDKSVNSWDLEHIPVQGLEAALSHQEIVESESGDARVRVGLTGVDAALAGTGSLILSSGAGKSRQASLLPPIHIAIVRTSQLVPDLEDWFAGQRERGLEHFRAAGNTFIVTGPSKTADIAQTLILGAHGPREVHIVLLDDTT